MTVRVDNSNSKLWRVQEAARMLNISHDALATDIAAGDIPATTYRIWSHVIAVNGVRLMTWAQTPEGVAKILELQGAQQ